jgi:3-dehydro-L-gulonate 2-dehydrogenase
VLDMAMSQFSYGALASYRTRGERLPVDGGFDLEGRLTRDPSAIEASKRPLPIGSWKGSGLSMLLDMMAALLSGGHATHEIPADPERETGISQVFIAVDAASLATRDEATRMIDAIVAAAGVRYPGQRAADARRVNLSEGVPVDPDVWAFVQAIVDRR